MQGWTRGLLAAGATALFVAVPVTYGSFGISQAEPCMPGAHRCELPSTAPQPNGAQLKCSGQPNWVGANVTMEMCAEPGDAELNGRPDSQHLPTPPAATFTQPNMIRGSNQGIGGAPTVAEGVGGTGH